MCNLCNDFKRIGKTLKEFREFKNFLVLKINQEQESRWPPIICNKAQKLFVLEEMTARSLMHS